MTKTVKGFLMLSLEIIQTLLYPDNRNKNYDHRSKKQKSSRAELFGLVRPTRLELVRCYSHAPQTCASADSATGAYRIP